MRDGTKKYPLFSFPNSGRSLSRILHLVPRTSYLVSPFSDPVPQREHGRSFIGVEGCPSQTQSFFSGFPMGRHPPLPAPPIFWLSLLIRKIRCQLARCFRTCVWNIKNRHPISSFLIPLIKRLFSGRDPIESIFVKMEGIPGPQSLAISKSLKIPRTLETRLR